MPDVRTGIHIGDCRCDIKLIHGFLVSYFFGFANKTPRRRVYSSAARRLPPRKLKGAIPARQSMAYSQSRLHEQVLFAFPSKPSAPPPLLRTLFPELAFPLTSN